MGHFKCDFLIFLYVRRTCFFSPLYEDGKQGQCKYAKGERKEEMAEKEGNIVTDAQNVFPLNDLKSIKLPDIITWPQNSMLDMLFGVHMLSFREMEANVYV